MVSKFAVYLVLIAIRFQLIASDNNCGNNGGDNKWPWLAAVFDSNENEYYLCTGTLIKTNQLITTATCIHNKDQTQRRPIDILIRLGIRKISDKNYLTAFPSEFFIFPNWKTLADVALVQFDNPVQLSINIHPICLSYVNIHVINEGVSVEFSTSGLKEERISILESKKCSSKLSANRVYSENLICGQRSCSTQSSGLLNDNNGKWFLHGIALLSLPNENCSLSIFTKINQIKDFIQKHSTNFSSENETQTYQIRKTNLNNRFGITEGIAVITDGAANFAMKLLQSLNQITDNFVVSSFSIYSSLLVVSEGTEGDSLVELKNALSISDLDSLRIAHRTLNYVLRYFALYLKYHLVL